MRQDSRPGRSFGRRLSMRILVTGLCATAWASARADISYVDMFRNNSNLQTADGAAGVTSSGSFVNLELTSVNPGDYSAVTANVPTVPGTDVALTSINSTFFQYTQGGFPNQAAMDAAFPMGTYTFSATPTGGGGPDVATLDYRADDYAQSTPFLAGTSYSALQNYNPSTTLHLQFSPDNAGSTASNSFIFFSIYDAGTGNIVFTQGFLPPSTTGVDIPAGTLLPTHAYNFELDFSNRDNTTGTGGAFAPFVGFDLRTDGSFTTRAVPEPISIVLLAQAGLGLGWAAIRKRSRGSAC
jgi:hypothetical protein